MFLVNLTYIVPLDEVDRHLQGHKAFLNDLYDRNKLLLSGRKQPRTGGLLLLMAEGRSEAEALLSQDPFWQNKLASYEFIEFAPTGSAAELRGVLNLA